MIAQAEGEVILIDYYQGAYGPTMRIELKSPGSLVELQRLFGELAVQRRLTVTLRDADVLQGLKIRMLRMKALCLTVLEYAEPMKVLRRETTKAGLVFHWSRSALGWAEVAELLDPMCEHQSPAHQYLTREGVDDALVELAFLEE